MMQILINGVPAASIQLKSAGVGTFTNSSGAFVFSIPKVRPWVIHMVISCIGYKTFSIPVRTAMNRQQFALEPSAIELEAVTVRAKSARELMKEVLEQIPQNFDTTDTQFTAFYRENVWMGDARTCI